MPTITALITKFVKANVEIAVMDEAKFYDISKNSGRKNEDATQSYLLTGRSAASLKSSKHDKKNKIGESRGSLPIVWIVIQNVRLE